ncbi:hypothetical protein evm_009790 [Chilo suppressalis]|nr:hypothetical protein evm_009790 [Chilo suppressalis]
MPFISKDWRSPGEEWVKTQEGWEKKKVLECTSQRSEGEDGEKTSESGNRIPPHCHITIKCTREIAGFNGLSEAVRRLDFSSAVRDVRRFNYICALLELLLGGQKLTHLPGAAQKLLLSMLEQLADQVATSKQNLNALRALVVALSALRDAERRACWGRPLGSRALWGHHDDAIDRINRIANSINIQEAASSAWSVMSDLCSEQRLWRSLVSYHFTAQQLRAVRHPATDWRATFHRLRRLYGLREDAQFAETLSLCRHCKCLFWRSLGHPCIADQCPEYRERLREAGGPLPPHPVPPAAFLKFFSL